MKDLTKGNPLKLILEFSFPILIGNIFQLFYSLADTVIVGSTLGENALASVGATSPISTLIIGFLMGLTNGFSVVSARHFGSKDIKKLKNNVAMTWFLTIITALFLTIVSAFWLKPLLKILNTPESIFDDAFIYIRIILLGIVVTALYNMLAGILRAVGDTITPLVFLIISTILNIGLDYLFIKGFNMGIGGAGYATVIAQGFSVILCLIYIIKRYEILQITKQDFGFNKNSIVSLYVSGLSMGFMLCFVYFGTLSLQGAINTLGTDTIVAHMGARKVTEIFMLPFSVGGTALATYCGQNLGAGEVKRIKTGITAVVKITWGWSILVIIASYTIAPFILKMITSSQSDIVINTACLYLKVDTIFYFVPALISILRNSMQGIGDCKTPVFSSFIELIGKVLIAILLTPKLGYWAIIIAEPIVWVLMVIPLIINFKRNPLLKET